MKIRARYLFFDVLYLLRGEKGTVECFSLSSSPKLQPHLSSSSSIRELLATAQLQQISSSKVDEQNKMTRTSIPLHPTVSSQQAWLRPAASVIGGCHGLTMRMHNGRIISESFLKNFTADCDRLRAYEKIRDDEGCQTFLDWATLINSTETDLQSLIVHVHSFKPLIPKEYLNAVEGPANPGERSLQGRLEAVRKLRKIEGALLSGEREFNRPLTLTELQRRLDFVVVKKETKEMHHVSVSDMLTQMNDCQAEAEKIILSFMPLILSLSKKYSRGSCAMNSISSTFTETDGVQYGLEGARKALAKLPEEIPNRATFARHMTQMIRYHMQNQISKVHDGIALDIPESHFTYVRKSRKFIREHRRLHGYEPSADVVAKKAGVSPHLLEYARRTTRAAKSLMDIVPGSSDEQSHTRRHEITAIGTPSGFDEDTFWAMEEEFVRLAKRTLDEWLPPLEGEVTSMRLGLHAFPRRSAVPIEEVAAELHLSVEDAVRADKRSIQIIGLREREELLSHILDPQLRRFLTADEFAMAAGISRYSELQKMSQDLLFTEPFRSTQIADPSVEAIVYPHPAASFLNLSVSAKVFRFLKQLEKLTEDDPTIAPRNLQIHVRSTDCPPSTSY